MHVTVQALLGQHLLVTLQLLYNLQLYFYFNKLKILQFVILHNSASQVGLHFQADCTT